MLSIAKNRLDKFPQVQLAHQNVTALSLDKQFDLAFSYGGVWYFVMDGVNEPFLVSHIYDAQANLEGMSKVAAHVQSNGHLLLGVQGPHRNYHSPITNGMCIPKPYSRLSMVSPNIIFCTTTTRN
jgi:hypothetical protein